MLTTLILTRHGETIWNRKGKLQGETDIPLSRKGVSEAKALTKRFNLSSGIQIHAIYTSKLKRAIHTAELATKELGIPIKKLKSLNERNYGIFEGKTIPHSFLIKEIKKGESKLKFEKRVISTFKKLLEKHKGETLLVVCHGGVIRVLFKHVKNISDEEIITYSFPNTSVSIFEINEGKFVEKLTADTSHLLNY